MDAHEVPFTIELHPPGLPHRHDHPELGIWLLKLLFLMFVVLSSTKRVGGGGVRIIVRIGNGSI